MEYGDVVRLEVASNLVLSEEERNMFLRSSRKIEEFINAAISDGESTKEEPGPDDRVVIPSSILRKDRSIEAFRLEEICITPGDIEETGAYMISPANNLSGDKK